MNIEPGTTIPLVYQNVTYVTDPTLYYVQAIIRDSITGGTLITKNLTHEGSGRYTSSFLAPQDTSGEGRHIDVTITLYTDSGYTTKSPDYQERNFNYVIKSARIFGGGSSSSSVDYEYIKKMIDALLKENLKSIQDALNAPEKEIEPINLSNIESSLNMLPALISDVKEAINSQEKVDISPLHSLLEKIGKELSQKIDDKEVTEATDLSNINSAISDLKDFLHEQNNLSEDNKTDILNKFKEEFAQYASQIKDINFSVSSNPVKKDVTPKSPYFQ